MNLPGTKKPAKQQVPVDEFGEVFSAPKRPSGIGGATRIVLTFIIILLLALTILVIYVRSSVSSAVSSRPAPSITGQVYGYVSLVSHGVLQYNNSRTVVEFAKLHYDIYNSANSTAILTVYGSNPVRKIYLVNTENYCTQCFVSSSLYLALNSSLRQYGLLFNQSSFNYIDINKIDAIPKQSIIIIPSGLMPDILLPDVTYSNLCPKYTNSTVLTLLNQGDIIVYVGENFTRSVTCSGQTVQTSPQTIQDLDTEINTSKPNLNFTRGVLYLSNTTFGFRFGQYYGSAVAVDVGQNGSMVALTEFPSVGWSNNYNLLAHDIAKVIASRFWIPVIANGTATIPGAQHASSNLTVFTTTLAIANGPGLTDIINDSYPLLKVVANNSANFSQYDIPVPTTFRNNGVISLPATVGFGVQTELLGQVYNSSNRVVIAYAQIYNRSLTLVKNVTIHFGQMGPTAVYVGSSFILPSGYYIINLTDQNNERYSSALFFVSPTNISATSLDFRNGTFYFSAYSDGAPVSGAPYSINLGGAYSATGYIQNGVLYYTLPKGTAVSYGEKTFSMQLQGTTFSATYPYNNAGFTIPPLYIEVAIEIVIVIVITKFLVPPNTEEYYIDVPDINPVQKQVLKESADALVEVFEKVNSYYHWKNMPLTVDEVKTGIGNNIRYGTTKISITARNTYGALSKLIAKGVVQEAGEYYALTKWIKESHHSIDYLVIYRKLRDFCVANAMLFTELDSSSNMDMIITNKSTQNFIKIYSEDMQIKDIEIKQRTRIFLAFLDEEKKQMFLDQLYTSYGKSAEMLKMAVAFGNVRLIDTDHIDELKL